MMAICLLAIIQLFHNIGRGVYNLFHTTKKKIYWDPMEEMRMEMDVTERFYHD